MSKDFYKTLEIEKSATPEEIKKAYRKLAMKYHPDQNKGDAGAEAKFKEINEAYDILKDEQKRQAFDRFGSQAFEGGRGPGGPGGAGFEGFGGAFSDIFEDMFGDFMGGRGGGGRGGAQAGRGSDVQYGVEITLDEAFKGKEEKIKMSLNEICDTCKGSGAESGAGAENCTTCDGHGRVRQHNGPFVIERTCPTCAGQGKIIKSPCKKCSGTGRTQKEKTLKVKIPAGVEHGRRIRLAGEGEAGVRGGPGGDLYILLQVKPHKLFKRDGVNLHCRVPVTVTKAAIGTEIEVPTIDGGRSKIKVPSGTQTGQQFRLRGKGMSVLNKPDARGDMYVEIFVETPVNLNKKQQDILKQLDASLESDKSANHSPESSGFFSKMKEFWDDLKD